MPRILSEMPNGMVVSQRYTGKFAPRCRKGGLRDVDGRRSGDIHHAEVRFRAERDEFFFSRGFGIGGVAKFRGIIEPEGIGGDRPFPRSHLGLHPPGVIHHHGQRAIHGRQLPALGQDAADIFLAALARDDQLHLRAQPERDAILDEGIDLDRKEVLVGLLGGGVALEPEIPLRIPGGGGDRLPLECEGENADFRRQRMPCGISFQRNPPSSR